MGELIT